MTSWSPYEGMTVLCSRHPFTRGKCCKSRFGLQQPEPRTSTHHSPRHQTLQDCALDHHQKMYTVALHSFEPRAQPNLHCKP